MKEQEQMQYNAGGNKKMYNMYILEILREYTDDEHSLTQQEILKLLRENYGVECDRRSVKSNIEYLEGLGIEIDEEDGYRLLTRDFDDAELRMLIESVLFSKTLSSTEAKRLVNKLSGLGSRYFTSRIGHIRSVSQFHHTDNKQVMITIDVLDEAIEKKKKIEFIYNSYGIDYKLHPRRPEPFKMNPYAIVASNGMFYLIGNYDKYENLAHYRIDKMTGVRILDEPVKDPKLVKGMEHGLNLPRHMAEHVYMFSGESVDVILRTSVKSMDMLIDWFGKEFQIVEKGEEEIKVRIHCNEQAMEYWALQYGKYVEVLEPETLRLKLRDDIKKMYEKYSS